MLRVIGSLGALAPLLAVKLEVTPLGKVVAMLDEMTSKGQAEMEAEQVVYAKYSTFCEDTQRRLDRDISDAKSLEESLAAQIEKNLADAQTLHEEVKAHAGEVAAWEREAANATAIREKDHTDFLAAEMDFGESIDAIDRAVSVLKKQDFAREQAAQEEAEGALAQLRSSIHKSTAAFPSLADEDKRALLTFLKMDQAPEAPQAAAYEFRSGSIVKMLKRLGEEFAGEMHSLQQAEMKARHAYEMIIQDLKAQIAAGNDQIASKKKLAGQKEAKAGSLKGELADVESSRAADEDYLKELTSSCEAKATDYDARQKLRQDELDAIKQARQIIMSKDVAGHTETYMNKMVQVPRPSKAAKVVKATSFLQSRVAVHKPLSSITTVADFLRSKARKFEEGSDLALLARTIARLTTGGSDPFKKVRSMIESLVLRLQEQATEEAKHNGWCETELATNKKTREQKTEDVNRLTAEGEKLRAEILKLNETKIDLKAQVVNLNETLANATVARAEDKAENEQTISDATDAQAAVGEAISILQQFYSKAAGLVQKQTPAEDLPDTWDSAYTGMQGSKTGVIGLMEVIQADFAKLQAETEAAEAAAAQEFSTFKADTEKSIAVKKTSIAHATNELATKGTREAEVAADLEIAHQELDAANEYYESLKPSCIDSGMTFEERTQRREEELQSLKEALKILSGESLAVPAP